MARTERGVRQKPAMRHPEKKPDAKNRWSIDRWAAGGVSMTATLMASSALMAPEEANAAQGISAVVENDVLTAIDVTDRNYTSGFNLSYWRTDDDTSRFARRATSFLFGDADQDPERTVAESFSVAHSFFTPNNLRTSALQPDDHPYAGWLRAGYDLTAKHGQTFDSLSVSLGLVGPAAGAEEIQKTWHRLTGDVNPQGWDNQLENEPVFQATWQRKWAGLDLLERSGLEADVRPVTEVNLGTGFVNASVGVELRLGNALKRTFGNGFGAPRVGPEAPSLGIPSPSNQEFGWFVFAGADARAVGHNLFVEGNVLRDSAAGVDAKGFVNDFKVGAGIQFGGVEVTYTYVSRSKEFDRQDERHRFGQVGVSFAF